MRSVEMGNCFILFRFWWFTHSIWESNSSPLRLRGQSWPSGLVFWPFNLCFLWLLCLLAASKLHKKNSKISPFSSDKPPEKSICLVNSSIPSYLVMIKCWPRSCIDTVPTVVKGLFIPWVATAVRGHISKHLMGKCQTVMPGMIWVKDQAACIRCLLHQFEILCHRREKNVITSVSWSYFKSHNLTATQFPALMILIKTGILQ